MSSWRDRAQPSGSWRDRAVPSGGAEGGPAEGGPINPGAQFVPPDEPIDPREIARREQEAEHEKMSLANAMSGGQYLSELGKRDPAAATKYVDLRDTGALAELLSFARGASGPFGAHLDEMAGAVKSRSLSGPDYEREKKLAQQTIDAATTHAPLGPVAGAIALPQPASALGRIALNATLGASEGLGGMESMEGAPTEAAKVAAVNAILSMLAEGAGKAARAGGSNLANRDSAARQALKASGLRGGISSQLAKRGMDDADAMNLGRAQLDEGLIPFGGSKATVRDRAETMMNREGAAYGAAMHQGDVAGKLDYDELGNAMLGPYNRADAVKQSAGKQALDLVDQFEEQGRKTPGSFVGASRAKASAWDSANFSDTAKNAPRLYRETMGAGAANIEEQLARVDPAAAAALKDAGKRYGIASDTYALAKEAAQRELENNKLGMTELLAGIGGATLGAPSGDPLKSGGAGLAAAILSGLAKRRGNAAAAVTLNKLSGLGRPLEAIGKVAPRLGPAAAVESRDEGLLRKYLESLGEESSP